MIDQDVRLTQVYVAPTGSSIPNNTPNSADIPLPSFDLFVTGEEGDERFKSGLQYTLRYDACDLTTCNKAPAPFNAVFNQNFGAPFWVPIPRPGSSAQEDYVTIQRFTIPVNRDLDIHCHVFQYTVSLCTGDGDIVSFLQSEPFILV